MRGAGDQQNRYRKNLLEVEGWLKALRIDVDVVSPAAEVMMVDGHRYRGWYRLCRLQTEDYKLQLQTGAEAEAEGVLGVGLGRACV